MDEGGYMKTQYLWNISIGPVQDFIAAARRTRDLWFGSYLLSEITKNIAQKIIELKGDLIFPIISSDDLNKDVSISNVVLCILPTENPQETQKILIESAKIRWRNICEEIEKILSKEPTFNKTLWDRQITDFLEIYIAWKQYEEKGYYSQIYGRLMQIFTARKSIRDFDWYLGADRHPKSSLDGSREAVMDLTKINDLNLKNRIRPAMGEQLDAIGLVKRLGNQKTIFPSVSRIALEPWINYIIQNQTPEIKNHLDRIQQLLNQENSFSTKSGNYYLEFPFDGQIFFKNNEEVDKKDEELFKTVLDRVEKLKKMKINNSRIGDPSPYFTILQADGDKIGAALASIQSIENHKKFSQTLSDFSKNVRNLIETRYKGVCVYSGGDDILAFLPVHNFLDCAREIYNQFSQKMVLLKNFLKPVPTLSVGISIGHYNEDLGDLLSYSRSAEYEAKNISPERRGFAIHIHKKGGAPLKVRMQWNENDQTGGLDQRLKTLIQFFSANEIPSNFPYAVKELQNNYAHWEGNLGIKSAIGAELKHLMIQKNISSSIQKKLDEFLQIIANEIESSLVRNGAENELVKRILNEFGQELLVALQISHFYPKISHKEEV
jgi:CRISPR-associated protein Cmr2